LFWLPLLCASGLLSHTSHKVDAAITTIFVSAYYFTLILISVRHYFGIIYMVRPPN
jgi:hypothetical protein